MTQGQEEPRTQRQRLGAELRRLRMLAGVSGRAVADRTGLSQSKVSRIERGEGVPSVPEVTAWARESAAGDHLAQLVAMTEAALNEVDAWRTYMGSMGLPRMQHDVRANEAAAGMQRSFVSALVPGLMQTAEYARRVFIAVDVVGGQDYAAAVQARMDRQQVLYEQQHEFEFIVTEAALRWRPGPAPVLRAQLDRIASIATLGNVTLGVVPLDIESSAIPWHGFTIYEELPEGRDPFVTVETFHAYLTASDPDDVDLYRTRLAEFRNHAVYGNEARTLLTRLADGLRDEEAQ